MAEDGNPRLGQSLIPAINKLQDVFAQLGSDSTIDLPQVAVVGSRSSGKSSVLEALVGRDFLPRGLDICTRRPLVLQLVQNPLPADDSEYAEWGEFLHLPNRRFTDFSAIRSEIQAETEREAGANKGVSDKQIRLKIFSPYVLNINLVDLPGISKVPVGDQPTDIEARIRTMILSYIKHATCIILAVSPANSDLVNSDALQMARLADPDGSRTIGVITKLDIMDRGTDACNFLLGKVIPLRLGYFGVINRGQEDIVANRSIQDALAHEENFFHTHPVYHSLAERCGIPQLAKKLSQILAKHIRVMLPDLRSRINAQMVSVKKELSSCGKIPESKSGQGALLLRILTKFSDAFTSGVDGKNQEMSTSELAGGARINYIFQSIFVKRLEEVDPCDDLTDKDIQTAIQNATGSKHALFVPEVPFQVLVRRQIARLLDPSLQCVRFIYDELIKLAHQCETSDVHRFPLLWRHLEEVVGTFLREGLAPAETMVGHLIAMEMDYINTSHPAFIGGSKAIVSAIQQQKSFATSVSTDKSKEGVDIDRVPAAQKAQKLPTILARTSASGLISNSAIRPVVSQDKTGSAGRSIPGTWGISSLFGVMESYASANGHSANKEYNDPVHSSILGVGESHASANGRSVNKEYNQPVHNVGPISSTIQLKEPPAVLRPIEAQTEQEAIGIAVTRKLLRSYFDIVRKNVQDFVPKAIMHFLVNHAKRELRTVLIENLYKENSFSEMLEEREDIAIKRKQCRKVLQVLQQAIGTLDELSLDFDMPSKQAQQ